MQTFISPTENRTAGEGLIQQMALSRDLLASNACDIESQLFGIRAADMTNDAAAKIIEPLLVARPPVGVFVRSEPVLPLEMGGPFSGVSDSDVACSSRRCVRS